MVFEIGGHRSEAKAGWKEVAMRFPPTRVNALADVAREISEGRDTALLVSTPYEAEVRSELFYWAGRLFEKRGDAGLARRLMRLAVKEDPTRRWPAELARRWLKDRRSPA
jgi:hypothetical protein